MNANHRHRTSTQYPTADSRPTTKQGLTTIHNDLPKRERFILEVLLTHGESNFQDLFVNVNKHAKSRSYAPYPKSSHVRYALDILLNCEYVLYRNGKFRTTQKRMDAHQKAYL